MPVAPWVAEFLDLHGAEIAAEGLGAPTIARRWGLTHYAASVVAAEARRRGVPARRAKVGTVGYAPPQAVQALGLGQPEQPVVRNCDTSPQVSSIRTTGRTHLVIGDAHAEPGHDLDRFAWLGRMVRELRPDVVISIGDWYDMPSLSAYDVGKRAFEGRRYVSDLEAGHEALRLFHRELGDWRGRLVVTLGNHEARIERATNDNAALEGAVSLEDLDFARRGWWVVPYQESFEIDGVHYSHMVPSGVMNRPVGGMYHAASLIRTRMVSTVVGHSHLLDYAIRTDGSGRRVQGLVVGCYFDAHHGFAGAANALYWRGICVLRNVHAGTYDLETWSLDRIRQTWGAP